MRLDPALTQAEPLRSRLAPFDAVAMEAHPVSPHVNSPTHDDPRCVEAVGDALPPPDGKLFDT